MLHGVFAIRQLRQGKHESFLAMNEFAGFDN
jgi:hypothetical protein